MDRDRFRKRAADLRSCADLVERLTRVPDRATRKDFEQVSDLMTGAATDIEKLIKAEPPGCVCRRIQDNDYDYLEYNEGCLHHRQLYLVREKLKADYERLEKKLKDEPRMRLLAAVLSDSLDKTSAPRLQPAAIVVDEALTIVDEAIRRLAGDAKP